jgi:glutaconate CoA-transferase subunit B
MTAAGPGPNGQLPATADEVMTVVAARQLADGAVCFVGIGLPSLAANLARRLHAPRAVLIYESGTIGAKPTRPPLSIGDGELAETADAVVGVPEIFAYWLQAGRIDVGFLGAAQIDRYGNINTTVIGDYQHPAIRLPGAGGAPEIASSAGETIVILRQNRRTFVDRLDFRTSVGHLRGGRSRQGLGVPGQGPTVVITDLGVLRPDPSTREFVLVAVHPGVSADRAVQATGWPLRVAAELAVTVPPDPVELFQLRTLVGAGVGAGAGAGTGRQPATTDGVPG